MLALKLAYKNLMGAGLRTWLNVAVLSFAFVVIVFYNGMIDGWNRQGRNDTQQWETGSGQYWVPGYDKFDPYSIKEAHLPLTEEVNRLIRKNQLCPVLLVQAEAYPNDRLMGALLKGVLPQQKVLKLPSQYLDSSNAENPVMIGRRMAANAQLKLGDQFLIRWRDKNGTYDARMLEVCHIFDCDVPSIDNGQIYMRMEQLQQMSNLEGEASILVAHQDFESMNLQGWEFKDLDFLLADLDQIIQSKKAGGTILQGLLLIIALLAIFDTQVLAIFRRQKEIGTYIALGMTRSQVVGIFTIEGGAHSILAALLGAVWGVPILLWLDTVGLSFGDVDMGIPMAATIYPYYSVGLIISSLILVVLSATIVSYFPARKISKMKATEALKGKLQ